MLQRGASWRIRNKANDLPVRHVRKALHLNAMKASHKALGDSQAALAQDINAGHTDGDLLTRSQSNARSMAQNFPSVVSINFDADIKIKANASPIARSAQRRKLGAVEDMLDAGVVPTPDALYLAADECRSDVVEVLADVMDDIDTAVGWGRQCAVCSCMSHRWRQHFANIARKRCRHQLARRQVRLRSTSCYGQLQAGKRQALAQIWRRRPCPVWPLWQCSDGCCTISNSLPGVCNHFSGPRGRHRCARAWRLRQCASDGSA
jgi:hypothetical protein